MTYVLSFPNNWSQGLSVVSSHSNKEWKPKSTQKQSTGPGVIGTPSKSASPPADALKNLETDSTQLPSHVDISDNENVIIAPHIRVSATDRFRVTFGSVGTEFEPSRNPGFEAVKVAEEPLIDPSGRFVSQKPAVYLFACSVSIVASLSWLCGDIYQFWSSV